MEQKSHFTLTEIADWHENEKVSLPAVQRGFVWKPSQIENLWDSLLRGYPVGSFVFSASGKDKLHILDGQQRATAVCLGFAKDTFRDSQDYYKVFIDLEPPKADDPRKFLIRVITKSHPWGYRKQDNTKTLSAENIRKALNVLYTDVSDPLNESLECFFPYDADLPVPLHYFLNAATVRPRLSDLELSEKIKENYQHWQLVVKNWKRKFEEANNKLTDQEIEEQIDKKIKNIYKAVQEIDGIKIPALYMNLDKLMNSEEQEAEDESDEVENLFVRLNSGGTQLSGEELNYSILKAHLEPKIQEIIEEACKGLFKPARFITIVFRLYQQDIKEGNQADALTMRIKPKQFQRRISQKNETLKSQKSFEKYILELISDKDFQGKTLLEYAKSVLKYKANVKNHYGLPFLIYSKISDAAPELMFLLLYRIKYKGDLFSSKDALGEKEHRIMLGMLTLFMWFGKGENQKDHTKLLANLWPLASSEIKEKFWSAETVKFAFNDDLFLSFPRFKKQPFINSNDKKSRSEILADFIDVSSSEKKDQQILQKIIYNRSLILYAQRHFIENYFNEKQYALEDTALPFDWDHISPNSFVKHKKNKNIPQYVKEWYQTNGNFRAWPYELNRMDNDNSPSIKLNPLSPENNPSEALQKKWKGFIEEKHKLIRELDEIPQRLIDWSFCHSDWQNLPNSKNNEYWQTVTESIISRNFYIIKEWYDQLNIDDLHVKE